MVSIIIPTSNRCDQLERTLLSLVALPTPTEYFEIIVVENGVADETCSMVRQFQKKYSNLSLHYFYEDIPGLLTGRHRGAKEAKGDVLTFIDDDVHVSKNWLDSIIEIMKAKPEVMLLTGPNLPKYEIEPPNWIESFWTYDSNGKHCGWLSLLDFGNQEKEIDPNFVWGLNFTIRKSAFEELEGFHPDSVPTHLQHLQGDGETGLTIKAKENRKKAIYHPNVLLHHEVPKSRLTVEYFEKRAYYQGICNSFTEIRKINGLYKAETPTPEANKVYKYFKQLKKNIKKIITTSDPNQDTEPVRIIFDKLRLKEKEGFEFHQNQFNKEPKVRTWALKPNFFNYDINQTE